MFEFITYALHHKNARMPERGSSLAAGYDLFCCETEQLVPGARLAIPLGFSAALPKNLHGRIESRSGNALKGLVVLTGVIDADYRGEWKVIMQNFSDKTHVFNAGDRVAQLVLRETKLAKWTLTDSLEATERGSGGFGSTGA